MNENNVNVSTTTSDLQKLAKKMKIKNFQGVFASDQVKFPLKKGGYIINYDVSTGEGSHWACLNMTSPKNGFWISSFGDPPLQMFDDHKVNLVYNNVQVQSFKSNMCGVFCIAYLFLYQQGLSNEQIFTHIFNSENESTRFKNNYLLQKLILSR